MKILIATENQNKAVELKGILPVALRGETVEYLTLKEFPGFIMPEENGATLEENAVIKARAAAAIAGLPALADDTGLEVDALNGAPGVKSARYAGADKDVTANNRKLLKELDGLPLEKRTARFKTVACYAEPCGKVITAEGTIEGYIGFDYKGKNGFGYDPLFIVKGTEKTLAELSLEEKNKISHRKKAFVNLTQKIK